MEPYKIIYPENTAVPILISIPHCGFLFPDELKRHYDQQLIKSPDDTDWFVDQLYDFATSMGITIIKSVYSRWVIDLNRDPESKPLYNDGRIITGLVPTTTFSGDPLYVDANPDDAEINRRIELYYQPYHDELDKQLLALKSQFGKALLWEAHSIRQHVPTISLHKFPDLILGDNEGATAASNLISVALKTLSNGSYLLSHNSPFKGGHITRKFGNPDKDVHALQLEMTKINYMDDAEIEFDKSRASNIKKVLVPMFEQLIKTMG